MKTTLLNIPVIFSSKFPKNYINNMDGWAFDEKTLKNNFGKILTLDIDFGNYCSLNCPHCFRRNNMVDCGKQKLMGYEDSLRLVKEAKKMGLRSVKFLGAGEPFQNKRFLEFLRELKKLDIIPLIFTKGHVIGDDQEVSKWNSDYGVFTGEQLIQELKKVNATILLGFNSFNFKIQDKMVGGVPGYTEKRNRALKLLVDAGFNAQGNGSTKLALIATPITRQNFNEIFKIYKWGRVRNIFVVTCPTMVSGRCGDEAWKQITPSPERLIALYSKIYKWNIRHGLQTLEQIEREGISSYAGTHPCNQVACGMYVTLTGTVLRCPGDDTKIFGSLWKQSLQEIWVASENYKRSGVFNCGCPPKVGKSIPCNLFAEVIKNLKE